MQRTATALIALLAVAALAVAAGSFASLDGPSLQGSEELEGDVEPQRPVADGGTDRPTATDGGGQVSGDGDDPPPTASDGGVSGLFVVGFLGALLASAVLAILLTGDDERAPEPEDDAPGDGDPRPTVALSYDSPGDNAVVNAWRRLTAETGADDSRTPGETARQATEQGLPREAVSRLADEFRAVRYGERPVDERREQVAREALEDVEEGRR